MADDTKTWELIHAERRAIVEMLGSLHAAQWASPSLCTGWTVQQTAAHLLASAEQTPPHFVKGLLGSGFRFNAMVAKDLRRLGALTPGELVARLAARTTTTNAPPAPAMAMLGEAVVHGADIRTPLGLPSTTSGAATIACLDMYRNANFPVGSKRRIAGLRLVADDVEWSIGSGPEVTGPAGALLLAVTGRPAGLEQLRGAGLASMRGRFATAAA